MSSLREFMVAWNLAHGQPMGPYSLDQCLKEIEAMDSWDKVKLMDLEDHIEDRISNAIWEVEAGEDM